VLRLDPEPVDPFDREGSFLQSAFWAAFKASFGWKSKAYLSHDDVVALRGRIRVMLRTIKGPLCFAYVPGGPSCDCPPETRSRLLLDLANALRQHLPALCLFVRFDPPWHLAEAGLPESRESPNSPNSPDSRYDDSGEGSAAAAGIEPAASSRPEYSPPPKRPVFAHPLVKAAGDVQPPDSVILDLARSEEELLSAMKPKWRYNIKLAGKKGVVVEDEGLGGLGDFYSLYEVTARRDRIAIHPRRYYERLFEVAASAPGIEHRRLRLLVARHESEAIASIIVLERGTEATYLYGASSDSKRSLMPAYALQWTAIRGAKASGRLSYDFYGIPSTDDPSHPMAGLYRFKTGFGGTIVHYPGSWDLPLLHIPYAAWTAAERLRLWWFKVARKRLP
jgi:lipid II:glycine glycyltransferase (peptidoglycan interpeptide bridge formation enzyme)